MALTIVMGAQWGDEGKGKITDLLASSGDYSHVVRYGGGNNAGHTVVNDKGTFKLHILPSGILHPQITNIIATGTVVDAEVLSRELNDLGKSGITNYSLAISSKAHLVMPWHRILDGAQEARRSDAKKIGTTKQGMGPARTDKHARTGFRVGELLNTNSFKSKFVQVYAVKSEELAYICGDSSVLPPVNAMLEEYIAYAQNVIPHIRNTEDLLYRAVVLLGKNVLFEGAQGALLDIDHGTYPYVTSSACTAQDAFQGSGIPFNAVPSQDVRVIGIVKAYTTRVGAGAFPTFAPGGFDEKIREAGREFGTTTGRPRMCAPIDLPMLDYASRLNGFTEIVITKLDVLSELKNFIPVGRSYKCLMESTLECMHEECGLGGASANLATMPAWGNDITHVRQREELPKEAENYVEMIEGAAGVRASYISVGPDRDQTIVC